MAGVSVRIEGFKQLDKRLKGIGPKGVSKIMSAVLRTGAFKVQSLATTKYMRRGGGPPVPGILTIRTGTLARSIGTDFSQLPARAEVGTNVVYAARHEFGDPKRPFMTPAADKVGGKFLEDVLSAQVEKALR